ncbi:zinc ribbon domain-containing protein [bacterium]|nr:zinc ribbon domain-containing protein [bacterium]
MPIYEYRCEKCGDFEVTQRITEDPLKKCPTCRRKVRKLISNTSFQLKGSGWYITDYARKGAGGKDAGGESSGKAESGAGSETKSEAKSEAKSPAKSESKAKKASAKAA